MTRTSACADNLILLGETVQMAADYIIQCQKTLRDEERWMVKLAHDQIAPLRVRIANLDQSLVALKLQLNQEKAEKRKSKDTPQA